MSLSAHVCVRDLSNEYYSIKKQKNHQPRGVEKHASRTSGKQILLDASHKSPKCGV
jgi:hypothetical protein